MYVAVVKQSHFSLDMETVKICFIFLQFENNFSKGARQSGSKKAARLQGTAKENMSSVIACQKHGGGQNMYSEKILNFVNKNKNFSNYT